MDDQDDSQYSRAPQVEDVVKVCRALNEQGAKYVLIGGFAVIFHGYVRGTKDIDFLIDASPDNVKKVKQALTVLPDNAAAEIADDEVNQYSVVRIGDEVVIDLMAKACQHTYDMAKNRVDIYEIDGIEIPVANKELLIKLKDTVRPSDKADVIQLLQLIAAEKKENQD